MARVCSSKPAPRRFIDTPAATNSSFIQPWPIPTTSRPSLSRSSVASRRARMTGLWNSESSTLVPSEIRLVFAATKASVSMGSYTLANGSGACITGPPGPPRAIGTVGRISRSHVQTESNPRRSASCATCAIASGEASRPAIGRCTPTFIAFIVALLWTETCNTRTDQDAVDPRPHISVRRCGSSVGSGALAVVGPCIAEWGWFPAACDRVGATTGGAAHDVRRDQRVSLCRGGLAPTASLTRIVRWSLRRLGQAAAAGSSRARVPWVAMAGSHVRPVVITACRCRRIAAAMTVWAWVGRSLLCSRVVRCR